MGRLYAVAGRIAIIEGSSESEICPSRAKLWIFIKGCIRIEYKIVNVSQELQKSTARMITRHYN